MNTASYALGSPPIGSLAQGSLFSIYGSDMGPEPSVRAGFYPLPSTLGGVSVQIVRGLERYDAYLIFVSSGQINAILPSNVPVGDALAVVSYNGRTSQPVSIQVVQSSLGIFFQRVGGRDFAIAQNYNSASDYPLNLPDTPAKPDQIVILWGTGLGPVTLADNRPPGATGDMVGGRGRDDHR